MARPSIFCAPASRPDLRALLVAAPLWALLAAADGQAAELMVLPIPAESGLAETAFGIENVLRSEVEALGKGELLTRDDTVGTVAGAKSIGVECGASDEECLQRIGELAEVKTLVSPSIKTMSGDRVVLFLGVLDVPSGEFSGQAEGPVRLETMKRQRDVRDLVREAFGLAPVDVSTMEGQPDDTGESAEGADEPGETGVGADEGSDLTETEVMEGGEPEQPPETMDPTPLVVLAAGGAAAAVGAVSLVGGAAAYAIGLATAGADASLAGKVSNAQGMSQAAVIGLAAGGGLLAVGVLTMGVAGGLFAFGMME